MVYLLVARFETSPFDAHQILVNTIVLHFRSWLEEVRHVLGVWLNDLFVWFDVWLQLHLGLARVRHSFRVLAAPEASFCQREGQLSVQPRSGQRECL